MSIKFLKGIESDYEEIVDFANYVFSHSGGKTDFPSLLPKLYKREYNTMENHYIVKENGKIKAIVGVFPMDLMVLDKKLKVGGIGTVSVHPIFKGGRIYEKINEYGLRRYEKTRLSFKLFRWNETKI